MLAESAGLMAWKKRNNKRKKRDAEEEVSDVQAMPLLMSDEVRIIIIMIR